jgi:hypothetical protein
MGKRDTLAVGVGTEAPASERSFGRGERHFRRWATGRHREGAGA